MWWLISLSHTVNPSRCSVFQALSAPAARSGAEGLLKLGVLLVATRFCACGGGAARRRLSEGRHAEYRPRSGPS